LHLLFDPVTEHAEVFGIAALKPGGCRVSAVAMLSGCRATRPGNRYGDIHIG
jgi:hypothetical protein